MNFEQDLTGFDVAENFDLERDKADDTGSDSSTATIDVDELRVRLEKISAAASSPALPVSPPTTTTLAAHARRSGSRDRGSMSPEQRLAEAEAAEKSLRSLKASQRMTALARVGSPGSPQARPGAGPSPSRSPAHSPALSPALSHRLSPRLSPRLSITPKSPSTPPNVVVRVSTVVSPALSLMEERYEHEKAVPGRKDAALLKALKEGLESQKLLDAEKGKLEAALDRATKAEDWDAYEDICRRLDGIGVASAALVEGLIVKGYLVRPREGREASGGETTLQRLQARAAARIRSEAEARAKLKVEARARAEAEPRAADGEGPNRTEGVLSVHAQPPPGRAERASVVQRYGRPARGEHTSPFVPSPLVASPFLSPSLAFSLARRSSPPQSPPGPAPRFSGPRPPVASPQSFASLSPLSPAASPSSHAPAAAAAVARARASPPPAPALAGPTLRQFDLAAASKDLVQLSVLLLSALDQRSPADVVAHGCDLVSALAAQPGRHDGVGASSCCRAVVGALNAFPDSRAVALRGLDALFRLAHDEANQTQLGAAGACAAVTNLTKIHATDGAVQGAAVRAAWILAADHEGHADALSPCCELFVAALLNFPRDRALASWTCKAIVNLTAHHPSNAAKCGAAGGCGAVVACVRSAPRDASVCLAAVRSILNLTCSDATNRVRVGAAGGCKVLLSLFEVFQGHRDIILSCCVAIDNLARDNDNRLRLRGDDALGRVVGAMSDFPTDRDVQFQGCRAVYFLTGGSCTSAARDAVRAAMREFSEDAELVEEASDALGLVAAR